MFRARRALILAICVLFAYGMQLSAAVAAPPDGLPPCRDDHPAHVDLSHIPPCQEDEPPAEVPPVEELPADEPSIDPPASNDLPPCTEDHPAVPDLSDLPPCQDETPEPQDPPTDELPAEVPPVEEPPADEPSIDPPASNELPPCTEDHPAVPDLSDLRPCQDETPEGGDPPTEDPPSGEPSTEQTDSDPSEPTAPDDQPAPDNLPPCTDDHPAVPDLSDLPPCQTPGGEPPEEQQPAPPEETSEEPQQPSAEDVSEGDLPIEEPLSEEPPSEEPPSEEPPSEELGAEDPPAEPVPAVQPGTSPATGPALTDPDSGDGSQTLALPAEQDPREVPIELTTRAGGDLTFDLSNVIHQAGAFTALAHLAPTNGTLSLTGLVATYTPNPGFYGVDAFTIRACTPSAACLDISVSVTVPPINDFLLTTGAALAEFFARGGSSGTYNEVNLLPGTTQRVIVPLAGLAALVSASLWFGLDSFGSVLRRWLAILTARS